jgi:hypothetical protein
MYYIWTPAVKRDIESNLKITGISENGFSTIAPIVTLFFD